MTTTSKVFAEQYPRTEEGWIKFPRDIERRQKLFPSKKNNPDFDVFEHPAKMNLFLVDALTDYITEPGDWILEPFGGTGSTALAATRGRNVHLLEVEDSYADLIKAVCRMLNPEGIDFEGSNNGRPVYTRMSRDLTQFGEIRLTVGDNRQTLPAPHLHDAVITSPPYSTALKPGSNPLEVHGREGTLGQYTKSGFNIGNLNPFVWEIAMRKVWEGCFNSLKPGAKMAVVNKDIMKSGGRELLSSSLIRQASSVGFIYTEWYKWMPPSTIRQETARNKGGNVIEDEDLIFFVKPKYD